MYLTAALQVIASDSFRYLREVVGPRDAALEFQSEIDGIIVNGIDLIRWNDEGKIVDFKVMVRPLKAVNLDLCRLRLATDQGDDARQQLTQALNVFDEGLDDTDLRDARALLGQPEYLKAGAT